MSRFQPGNNGGPGRPKGSKNKLQEAFWKDFAAAWEEYGIAALNTIANDDPAVFVKVAATLMPKDVQLDIETHYVMRAPLPAKTAEEWEQTQAPTYQ